MDRNLKFILILFPIILIGAYFYGLSFDNIVTGSVIGVSPSIELFIINCPDGYNEITDVGKIPSDENTACVRDSANLQTEVVLHCGDEFEEQGMIETVECTMVIP